MNEVYLSLFVAQLLFCTPHTEYSVCDLIAQESLEIHCACAWRLTPCLASLPFVPMHTTYNNTMLWGHGHTLTCVHLLGLLTLLIYSLLHGAAFSFHFH